MKTIPYIFGIAIVLTGLCIPSRAGSVPSGCAANQSGALGCSADQITAEPSSATSRIDPWRRGFVQDTEIRIPDFKYRSVDTVNVQLLVFGLAAVSGWTFIKKSKS